jgi:transposase
MRGTFRDQGSMFSYVLPEQRIPAEHPLRPIRELVRDALNGLSRSLNRLYSHEGRPSIPPEQLLGALLVQVLYGIRSERQLMEQLDYNLLFRWFVGLSPDDPIWDPTVFTKNRERLHHRRARLRPAGCRRDILRREEAGKMKRLSKDQKQQRAHLVTRLNDAAEAVRAALAAVNAEIAGKLNSAIENYNLVVSVAEAFRDEIVRAVL